ncbi:MAG: iron-sulfur cluster assembly accessory protein [Chthoniobacteraceae bacterium]
MLTLTDSAVKHLQELLREKGTPGNALRISVERGGCAGMSYEMKLDDPDQRDFSEERDGVKVVVDPASMEYLSGSTIDYSDDLAGAGFRIQNPKATRSCGCGTSFEPAPDAGAR